MMDTSEKLCIQWNDFKENTFSTFRELREDREFTDVTLACEDGQQIEAHKVVLVSSSPFFMELLKKNRHPHPLIYMRGLRSEDLMAIMDFLYLGEANVLQDNLDSFLALAEELRLKGLSEGSEGEKEADIKNSQTKKVPEKREVDQRKLAPPSNIDFEQPSSQHQELFDTTVALAKDKVCVELEDLDEQIRSMITKSDLTTGTGQGKLATCNICGKKGPYFNMPNHVEAKHITGVSHACDVCGKLSRSSNALNMHKLNFHDNRQQKAFAGLERA